MDGCFRVVRMEYGGAGHQDICTGFYKAGCVLRGDAAVDLDEGLESSVVDHATEVANFLEGMRNELLTTETGIDAHDQHQVDILHYIRQELSGGMRVKPPTGFHTQSFFLLALRA